MPDWGRRFGQLVRTRHRGETRAKPNLSFTLVLYGDEFFQTLKHEQTTRETDAALRARQAYRRAFMPNYLAYLREAEIELKRNQPNLYETFLQERNRTRQIMTGGLFVASADTLARFDSDQSRLEAFAEFFQNHPEWPVPDFWQWNRQRGSTVVP